MSRLAFAIAGVFYTRVPFNSDSFMPAIAPHCRVQQKQSFLSAEINGETVLLNDRLAEYYGLDPVASDIWQRLAQEVTVAQLVQDLVESYDGDPAVIEADVQDLLAMFLAKNILTVKS